MKKLFAMFLTFTMISAIGLGTIGCGKKEPDKKPGPAADSSKPKEEPKKP